MSDVFDEIISRLKQKAFIIYVKDEVMKDAVWLEDVKAILKQLKQNYVLVSKEKLKEVYKNLEIDKISGYYVNPEFFRMIEELLREK